MISDKNIENPDRRTITIQQENTMLQVLPVYQSRNVDDWIKMISTNRK